MHSHALIVHSFKEKNMSIFIRVSRHVSKKDFEFFKELRLIFVCIAICVFMLTDEILFPFQVHVHHDLINRKGVCVSQNVHIINFPWHMKSKWETLRKNELSTRRERDEISRRFILKCIFIVCGVFIALAFETISIYFSVTQLLTLIFHWVSQSVKMGWFYTRLLHFILFFLLLRLLLILQLPCQKLGCTQIFLRRLHYNADILTIKMYFTRLQKQSKAEHSTIIIFQGKNGGWTSSERQGLFCTKNLIWLLGTHGLYSLTVKMMKARKRDGIMIGLGSEKKNKKFKTDTVSTFRPNYH